MITSQNIRNDHHLHNYIKIMLRCERFSMVMNILMVVCILISSWECFYVEERGKRMQESSLEYVQMDCEHIIVQGGKKSEVTHDGSWDFQSVCFIRGDVLCWSDEWSEVFRCFIIRRIYSSLCKSLCRCVQLSVSVCVLLSHMSAIKWLLTGCLCLESLNVRKCIIHQSALSNRP